MRGEQHCSRTKKCRNFANDIIKLPEIYSSKIIVYFYLNFVSSVFLNCQAATRNILNFHDVLMYHDLPMVLFTVFLRCDEIYSLQYEKFLSASHSQHNPMIQRTRYFWIQRICSSLLKVDFIVVRRFDFMFFELINFKNSMKFIDYDLHFVLF